MEHLFLRWNKLSDKVKRAEHILLLSDFDGTLSPIAKKPELATLPELTKTRLQELTQIPRLTLGVISGRNIKDLQQKTGINDIIYTGNHGLQIESPGIHFVHPIAETAAEILSGMSDDMKLFFSENEGILVENKGLTLSLHYRLADETQIEEITRIFNSITAPFVSSGKIKITSGKKVYEVRPAVDWDKGKAIEYIVQKLGFKSKPLVLYMGDDVTDYAAFRATNKLAGISIYVGQENINIPARYFLYSPEEVSFFLEKLTDLFASPKPEPPNKYDGDTTF